MTLSTTTPGAPELELREIYSPVTLSPHPRLEIVRQTSRKIKVIVVADLICVWCYIAFKELNQAIEDLKTAYPTPDEPSTPTPSTSQQSPRPTVPEIDVEFRPFFINTTAGTQDDPIDRSEYFIQRFGNERQAEIREFARNRGKECGIDFHFNSKMRQTMRVHRLLYLAYARGGSELQTRLYSRLYHDFFEQPDPWTIDVTSVPQLATYAVEIGLIPDYKAAEAWLLSRAGEEDVMRLTKISSDCGITGVPFTVVEGKWAIGGGMEKDIYYKTLEKLILSSDDSSSIKSRSMNEPREEEEEEEEEIMEEEEEEDDDYYYPQSAIEARA